MKDLRFNWFGHQSRLDMAPAAVWRLGPAGAPITGHLLRSFMGLSGLGWAGLSWADAMTTGVSISTASKALVWDVSWLQVGLGGG
jgi:hypothetical protein